MRPYLITKSLYPENQETPINFIFENMVSEKLFYKRNHFLYPKFVASFYFLHVEGMVQVPKVFSMQDIYDFPSKTIKVVLECAGNKRALFEPKVFGEQWGKGALSQGIWKGVSLRTLLQSSGLLDTAKEIVFESYDYGVNSKTNQLTYYSRSLPLEKALHTDTILAYEYNGNPIPVKHGYPFRLIVPQWYAMASVKWIKKIKVIDDEFNGPFQTDDYVYYPNKDNDHGSFPVTGLNVNSIIQKPLDRQILYTGIHEISGISWTGKGQISKVEISLDGGYSWFQTSIHDSSSDNTWVRWSFIWDALKKGEYTILSKATDSEDREQPLKPFWNRKGYGYNAVDRIIVKVE